MVLRMPTDVSGGGRGESSVQWKSCGFTDHLRCRESFILQELPKQKAITRLCHCSVLRRDYLVGGKDYLGMREWGLDLLFRGLGV